jgi:hypothetical protein
MARRCSICCRTDRSLVDTALIEGVPLRKIVEQFGTSRGALSRHKENHLEAVHEVMQTDPRVQAAVESATETVVRGFNSLEDIHRDWQWARQELKVIVANAKAKDKSDIRAVEAIAKLATDRLHAYMRYAELRPEPVNITSDPDFIEFKDLILGILKQCPACNARVEKALKEIVE